MQSIKKEAQLLAGNLHQKLLTISENESMKLITKILAFCQAIQGAKLYSPQGIAIEKTAQEIKHYSDNTINHSKTYLDIFNMYHECLIKIHDIISSSKIIEKKHRERLEDMIKANNQFIEKIQDPPDNPASSTGSGINNTMETDDIGHLAHRLK